MNAKGLLLGLLGSVVTALPIHAQDAPAKNWSAKAELGASLFFGNTSQSAVTTSLTGTRADGPIEMVGRTGFAYGESSTTEGDTYVAKRAWDAGLDVNYDTGSSLNGFVRGRVESIYEKKIDLRYSAGGGGRYQFGSSDGIRSEASLALLAEKTVPAEGAGVEEGTVAKWAARIKLNRGADDDRVRFESDTTYEPEVSDLGTYTLTSRNSVAFQVNHRVAVQLSLVDAYDSQAVARGARSNNDGQLFFSLTTTF